MKLKYVFSITCTLILVLSFTNLKIKSSANDPEFMFNQTSSTNITGIASTTDQALIDSYLNVNADGNTWNISEAPFQIAPLRNSTMSGDTGTDAWVTSASVTAGTAAYGYNSTGGNPAPCYYHKATSSTAKAANIAFTTNQTFNYTFGLPASVTLSWDYQVIGNSIATSGNQLNITLVRPDGTVVTLDTVTFTSAVDWTRRTINIGTGNFSQSGTYIIQLKSNLVAAAKGTSNWLQAQWDNVFLNFTFYNLAVEHNTTVSYSGNLQSISVLINFSSTADKDYNMSIYDFSSNSWVSCQNISTLANVWYEAWCNITTNPTNYISSDNKISVRLNSTISQQQATLKEEYVQYYLYTEVVVQRWLEVDWSTSSEINSTKCTQASPCPFTQNSTFVVGAIVTCHTNPSGYDCGSIYGAVRYNSSSSEPDTLISITQGDKPFFIQEASPQNPKSCGTLSDGSSCTLSWVINATGDTLPAIYALDVNFTSTTYNIENNTLDSFVKINPQTYINVVLTNVPICFGSVSGGNIEVAASDGSKTECGTGVYGFPMNVYIESNVNTSLWLRGDSNLVNDSNSISVTNLRCANSSTASEKMSLVLGNYILFQTNIQSGTTVPVYWWLYIPAGTPPGTYTGNITILVNETS